MQKQWFDEELKPLPEHDILDGITYDRFNRMQYHPEFHHSYREKFSTSDLEYLCAFYESDNARSLAFELGKPEHIIRTKYSKLKQLGLHTLYKENYWFKFEAAR